MPKAHATASFGAKLSVGQYENVSPDASIGVEVDLPEGTDGEACLVEAQRLYKLARQFVESEIEQDIKQAKQMKASKNG